MECGFCGFQLDQVEVLGICSIGYQKASMYSNIWIRQWIEADSTFEYKDILIYEGTGQHILI